MKKYCATGDSRFVVCANLCVKVNKNRISNKYYVLFDKNSYLCRNLIKYKIQVESVGIRKFEASISLLD